MLLYHKGNDAAETLNDYFFLYFEQSTFRTTPDMILYLIQDTYLNMHILFNWSKFKVCLLKGIVKYFGKDAY